MEYSLPYCFLNWVELKGSHPKLHPCCRLNDTVLCILVYLVIYLIVTAELVLSLVLSWCDSAAGLRPGSSGQPDGWPGLRWRCRV